MHIWANRSIKCVRVHIFMVKVETGWSYPGVLKRENRAARRVCLAILGLRLSDADLSLPRGLEGAKDVQR